MGRSLPGLRELRILPELCTASGRILDGRCTWSALGILSEYYGDSLVRLTICMKVLLQHMKMNDAPRSPSSILRALKVLTFQSLELEKRAVEPFAMLLAALCANLRELTATVDHVRLTEEGMENASREEFEESVFAHLRHQRDSAPTE